MRPGAWVVGAHVPQALAHPAPILEDSDPQTQDIVAEAAAAMQMEILPDGEAAPIVLRLQPPG